MTTEKQKASRLIDDYLVNVLHKALRWRRSKDGLYLYFYHKDSPNGEKRIRINNDELANKNYNKIQKYLQ